MKIYQELMFIEKLLNYSYYKGDHLLLQVQDQCTDKNNYTKHDITKKNQRRQL